MEITEFVQNIVKHLIDYPEELTITQVEGEKGAVFEIRVNPADIGKVIGKRGATIQALRTILKNAGMRQGKRFILEILQ